MHGALVGVATVHGIDHVGHLLARAADGVFALLGEFPVGLDNQLQKRLIHCSTERQEIKDTHRHSTTPTPILTKEEREEVSP